MKYTQSYDTNASENFCQNCVQQPKSLPPMYTNVLTVSETNSACIPYGVRTNIQDSGK
jgi:hypothetical protein